MPSSLSPCSGQSCKELWDAHRLGNKQPLGNERGQGTVEYAIVTAAFLCVIVAGAALWRALSQGLFVDHGLASASHHLAGAATWIADVLVF